MDRSCGREQVHSGRCREPARGQGGDVIRPELVFGCATSASLPSGITMLLLVVEELPCEEERQSPV
jgi:hypothetical protein